MARATKKTAELIISKARTKAASKKCNVSGEFYGALDKKVRAVALVRLLDDLKSLL